MAIKPNTAVFTVRDSIKTTIDFASQSGTTLEVTAIPTSLDALNREVMMIQEVDFDIVNSNYLSAVMARQGASLDPAVQYLNGYVAVFLTEVDPRLDNSVLSLSSPHFIAARTVEMVAGVYTISDDNPDTATYSSVAFSEQPLFTTASSEIFLTIASAYQGNDPATFTAAPPILTGNFRAFAQRGRADADTYAAILTGLYA